MKKRLIFPGKTLRKQKSKKEDLSKVDKMPKPEEASEKKKSTSESPNVPDDAEAERTVRKPTRTLVIVRQAERDAIRAALQATMKVAYVLTIVSTNHKCEIPNLICTV